MLTNQELVEILNDALYDFVTSAQEEWLEMCKTRENNNELEFYRLLHGRSVSDKQIEQLKVEYGIDPNVTVVQMLEYFIEILGGKRWNQEEISNRYGIA